MTSRVRLVGVLLTGLGIAGAGALVLLGHRCEASGGHFHWPSATCNSERPIILQGDIHRV